MNNMKRIYFVRHGESEGNAGQTRQGALGALTEHGRKQASFLGKRFLSIPLDAIVTSSMQRAHETAEIIRAEQGTGLEIITTDLLTERRHPPEIIGKAKEDPEIERIFEEIRAHEHDPSWHFSSEENTSELIARALQALIFLRERQEQNLLVVSHSTLLRTLVAAMMFGEGMTSEELVRWRNFTWMENTGITLCEWNNPHRPTKWHLVTWNDHAHLGEVDS